VAAALAAAAFAAACRTGGVRPRFAPLPTSEVARSDRDPAETIVVLDSALRARGLKIVARSPVEGYLETSWFDVDTHAAVAPPFRRLDRIVKFRFFADEVQGPTRILAECVRRIAWDPSAPERDLERQVPDDHPGRLLMDSLLVVIRPDSTPPPPLGPR